MTKPISSIPCLARLEDRQEAAARRYEVLARSFAEGRIPEVVFELAVEQRVQTCVDFIDAYVTGLCPTPDQACREALLLVLAIHSSDRLVRYLATYGRWVSNSYVDLVLDGICNHAPNISDFSG